MFKHVHLQWFTDPTVAVVTPPAATPPAPTPPAVVPPAPEPELKADGTFLAQAPDKYKKDPKFLKDLLKHKSWGDVLDRLYTGEQQLTELQAKLAAAPQKPEEYVFDELKFPEHLAGDVFAKHREQLGAYLKAKDEDLRALALKAGLSKEAAKVVSGFFREAIFATSKATQDDYAKQRETGLTALKAEWKGDFAAQEEIARRAILTFGGEALVAEIAGGPGGGLENSPNLIKAFNKIGKAIGEGHLVPGKPGVAQPAPEQKRREELKKRYNKSPELTGEVAAATASPAEQAALDNLHKRYPSMGR